MSCMDVVDRWWMGVGGLMVDRVGAEDKRAESHEPVYKNASGGQENWQFGKLVLIYHINNPLTFRVPCWPKIRKT